MARLSSEAVDDLRQVAFVEAAHATTNGSVRVYFGGADAVVGTATVRFERAGGVRCEGARDLDRATRSRFAVLA